MPWKPGVQERRLGAETNFLQFLGNGDLHDSSADATFP